MKKRTIVTILCCAIATSVACAACASKTQQEEILSSGYQEESSLIESGVAYSITDSPALNIQLNPDDKKVFSLLEDFVDAVSSADTDKVLTLYDEVMGELYLLFDAGMIWYTKTNENIYDESAKQNMNKYMHAEGDAEELFLKASKWIFTDDSVDPALSSALALHINDDYILDMMKNYEEKNEEVLKLEECENQLKDEFSELCGKDGSTERLGLIYKELIDIRNKIAAIYGYDSYPDYMNKENYYRDYSGDDFAVFRDGVKEFCASHTDEISEFPLFMDSHDTSTEELLDFLSDGIATIDPYIEEVVDHFIDNQLYSMGSEDCRDEGVGYTCELYTVPEAYIYSTFSMNESDIDGIAHEFGHYCRAYYMKKSKLWNKGGCPDIYELHAQGLQALSYPVYEKKYPERADAFNNFFVSNMINTIVNGCFWDEFQRGAYSHPEWTIEELGDYYVQVRESYYGESDALYSNDWTTISDFYTDPMSLLSYSTSGYAALQILDIALDDYQKALDIWKDLLVYADEYAICAVCEKAGLEPLTDKSAVVKILEDCISTITD